MENIISIIVPVYNVEKYLTRCIESIIHQTYKNLEIILVDDGSPDNSPAICENYKDKDPRIIVVHQENTGLSGARNAGIDRATGDYIAFVDSDDYISLNMYEQLLKSSLRYDADLVICRYCKFYGDSVEQVFECDKGCRIMTSYEALDQMHGEDGELITITVNKLYKKHLFGQLRYPIGKLHEDEFLTYKVVDLAKVIVQIEDVLYYYNKGNGESITNSLINLYSTDSLEAFNERQLYFNSRGYHDLEKAVHRSYLDKIMVSYKLLYESKRYDRKSMSILVQLYRKKYRAKQQLILRKGYKLFYLNPSIYLKLKKLLG